MKDAPVRRFSCFEVEDGVYEHAQGSHVAYSDYAKVEAERDAALKALAGLVALADNSPSSWGATWKLKWAAARAALASQKAHPISDNDTGGQAK